MDKQQYMKFVKDCLVDCDKDFYDTISKNKLVMFWDEAKQQVKTKSKMESRKSDIQYFSLMYTACHTRGSDLDSFFAHEHHTLPPFLAKSNVI